MLPSAERPAGRSPSPTTPSRRVLERPPGVRCGGGPARAGRPPILAVVETDGPLRARCRCAARWISSRRSSSAPVSKRRSPTGPAGRWWIWPPHVHRRFGMHAVARAFWAASPACEMVLRSPNRLAQMVIELTGMDRSCRVEADRAVRRATVGAKRASASVSTGGCRLASEPRFVTSRR